MCARACHRAAMDKICAIAKKHNIKVIEDMSHAHGACYKGKMVGTWGDVAAMSVMSSKSLAVGEGGFLVGLLAHPPTHPPPPFCHQRAS